MFRAMLVIVALGAAFAGGYYAAPEAKYTPAIVQITACDPKAVLGYVLIAPEAAPTLYIGSLEDMDADMKTRVSAQAAQGKLRLGVIHFASPRSCGAI